MLAALTQRTVRAAAPTPSTPTLALGPRLPRFTGSVWARLARRASLTVGLTVAVALATPLARLCVAVAAHVHDGDQGVLRYQQFKTSLLTLARRLPLRLGEVTQLLDARTAATGVVVWVGEQHGVGVAAGRSRDARHRLAHEGKVGHAGGTGQPGGRGHARQVSRRTTKSLRG